MRANADFYRVILGEHGVAAFVVHLRRLIDQVAMQRLTTLRQIAQPKTIMSELIAGYFGGALLGTIGWWLGNNMALSPEDMAKYTLELTTNGFYRTIGLDNPLP